MFLREIKRPVSQLPGIGPASAKTLASIGITTVGDLLAHYPREYEDRSRPVPLAEGYDGTPVNTEAEVLAHDWFGFGNRQTLKIHIEDESGRAALICFGRNFLARKLVPGSRFRIYGVFQYRFEELQCSAFDVEEAEKPPVLFGRILPIYPLSGNLTQGILRKAIGEALRIYEGKIEDELPAHLLASRGLLPKEEAIAAIHYPAAIDRVPRARRTLVFEELFHLQLLVGRRAMLRKSEAGPPRPAPTGLQQRLLERLPFRLTPDQETVLGEIRRDTAAGAPMARLVQGDVGSGKTLVAFLAALPYIESGRQAAFMAPTELLARQHAANAARLLEPLGVRLAFLSGGIGDEGRRTLLASLSRGEIDLLVGTHALFTEDVAFRDLGLAIVDEQHRFGVAQRMALVGKGEQPDLLLMTATPIPRTLALTAFGDLDISTIRTMPEGRKPVITHLARHGNEGKVYEFIRKEVREGRQAYFVYPLIQQSEKLSLKDAETMFLRLRQDIFPGLRLGLIHSRVPEDEKRLTMELFVAGKIDILVATSVIEVGVDVPNASCMVVEHAERFGLPALHQLRGRVGRGTEQSYAFLVYGENLTDDGKVRLKAMMDSCDGFRIAEEDLALRGPGELTGTRQSGYLRLSIADLGRDQDTLTEAREAAFALLGNDPGLLSPEHKPLREVLRRAPAFRDDAMLGG